MFRQGKKHIANFIIEFETLAMNAENVRSNIIKTILEYLLITIPI